MAKRRGPPTFEETVELLGRVPALQSLSQEDLEQIAKVAVPRRYDAGEVVFRENDRSDTCYIVRRGHCRAVREHPGGRTITLATFGPGEIFGELAMFEEERRSATVEATEELEVVGVLAADMRRVMREHPEIALRLVGSLGRRLRETNERLARQSFQTVQSRVAAVLYQLVERTLREQEQNGERSDPDRATDVLIRATQADLAKLAGTSRESASRFLATLERAGLITQGRGRLVVHEPKALQRYVF